MKHEIRILSLLAVFCCLAFGGCQKDDLLDGGKYNTVITVKSDNAKTRYNLQNHGVEWQTGDSISVACGNVLGTGFFHLSGVENGVATFVGNIPADAPADGAYYAIYPAQDDLAINEGRLSCVAIQPQQTLTPNTFGQGDNTAVGYNNTTTMMFRNVGGLAKIGVSGNVCVKSITITNNAASDNKLSGRGTIRPASSDLAITWDGANSTNSVTALAADQANGLSVSGGKIFYIVLPPCELTDYTVTITDVAGRESVFSPSDILAPVTISRSAVTMLGAVEVCGAPASNQLCYTAASRLSDDLLGRVGTVVDHVYAGGRYLVTFGQDLTEISREAFKECSTLTSIELPQSVATIGEEAFHKCVSLTSVYMPGVTAIGRNGFFKCSSLPSVDMPSVTVIGDNAFHLCSNLTSVCMPNVKSLGGGALNGTGLTRVSLTHITMGAGVFYNCVSLTYASLQEMDTVKGNTFTGCVNLDTVDIGNAKCIDRQAFYNCTGLSHLYCSSTDTPTFENSGEYWFYNVPVTATLHLPDGISQAAWDAWDAAWPGVITPERPAQ